MFSDTTARLGDSENILLAKMVDRVGALAQPGDSNNDLLFKILTALNGAASAGAGISQAAADARYVLKTGGTVSGALTVTGVLESDLFTWSKTIDASSNTSPVAFEAYHETSGGAGGGALNGGVSIDFRADSDTTDRQLQVRIASLWSDATHATRTSHLRFTTLLSGAITECLRISNGAIDLRNGAALQIAAVAYHNPLSVYAAGTVYTLTAVSAAVDFGTTDPVLTFNAAGTYAVRARIKVALNGATFASNRTLTVKLRRTNNTAADLANSSTTYTVPVTTTITDTLAVIELPEILYTTALTNDSVTIFSDISVLPTAGSITIDEASIVAVRLS